MYFVACVLSLFGESRLILTVTFIYKGKFTVPAPSTRASAVFGGDEVTENDGGCSGVVAGLFSNPRWLVCF